MKENEQQHKNTDFNNMLWNLSADDIFALGTLVYWTFIDRQMKETKYLIKNNLLVSNYREKLAGLIGCTYDFDKEIDSGIYIAYQEDGGLSHESRKSVMQLKELLLKAGILPIL